MGDDQIQGLVTYAENPRWKCTTCGQGQTSAQVLAEVPEVIALKPDIVIILTGAYDLIDGIETSRTQPTVGNVEQMLTAFENAKIPAVVCYMLSSTEYDNYYYNFALDDLSQSGVIPYALSLDNTDDSIPVKDGIDFSSHGLAVAYPLVYQEIQSFHLGGMK